MTEFMERNHPKKDTIEQRDEQSLDRINLALNETREKIKKLAQQGRYELLQNIDVAKLDEVVLVLFERFLKGDLSIDVVQKNMEAFSLSLGTDAMNSFRLLRYMKSQLEQSLWDRS